MPRPVLVQHHPWQRPAWPLAPVAVVSKTARVKEEVLISKDATERTETVRDTVRREDVEITKDAGIERTAGSTAASTTAPDPKV